MFINLCSSFIYSTHEMCIPSCLKWQCSLKYVNYVFCEQEKRRPASMQISLFISTRVHQWSGGTDGQTNTVLIGRSLSTGSATC